MFCTEMDGIESLSEVVIILASNRADLIDPAILRPGRIDRKIKVNRPTREGAREIFKIYLAPDLPYDPALVTEAGGVPQAIEKLADSLVDTVFAKRDENKFLSITLRSGKKETLYRGDLISGAIIASIVERAKGLAIKRAIASQQEEGISESDLRGSLEAEYLENDIFPPSDITEDWLSAHRLRLGERGQGRALPARTRSRGAERGGMTEARCGSTAGPPQSDCILISSPMKRVFGIETEYGITVDGVEDLDVVRESIEIVRSYTEHGALDEMGLQPRGPAPGCARLSRGGAAAGHRRGRLFRDR